MKFVKALNEAEIETLQQMHGHHPSRRARMRAHCLLLSHKRYKLKEIAQVYHVDHRRVSVWIDRWHDEGLVGLYDQPRSGRPPIYSDHEQTQVDHFLHLYPQDVKRVIEEMAIVKEQLPRLKHCERVAVVDDHEPITAACVGCEVAVAFA